MSLAIIVTGSQVIVGSTTYHTLDYHATNDGDTITVHNKLHGEQVICEGLYSDLTLNGATYASVTEWVAAFNTFIAAKGVTDLQGIRANTDYPDTLFSSLLTPVAQANVCNHARPGWFILSCPATNAGVVNFGPTGVGATSAGLSAGGSITMMSGDLSKWFVKNQTASDVISVAGEYKA